MLLTGINVRPVLVVCSSAGPLSADHNDCNNEKAKAPIIACWLIEEETEAPTDEASAASAKPGKFTPDSDDGTKEPHAKRIKIEHDGAEDQALIYLHQKCWGKLGFGKIKTKSIRTSCV